MKPVATFLMIMFAVSAISQKPAKPVPPITMDKSGKLVYVSDSDNNRIPDFSYCGYYQSERFIPEVPVKIFVNAKEGDATSRIQSAIDYVSSLPLNKDGFRGTVLLGKGIFDVCGSIKICTSGVILRGSGMGEGGTIINGKGLDRETLVIFNGNSDKKLSGDVIITDDYVPVNAFTFNLESLNYKATQKSEHNSTGKIKKDSPAVDKKSDDSGYGINKFKIGDIIVIKRPGTKEWIDATGTEYFGGGISALGWKPGNLDIRWERKIVKINGTQITVEAPITTALDKRFGISTVCQQNWDDRISNCGLENIQLVSDYDKTNIKDENHRWMAVTMENIENSWVRRVVFRHFAGSAVYTLNTSKQITVEDCKSFDPVSEIGGHRRNTFFNEGQLNLFQRIYAEFGFHDFAAGQLAAGPNAFVQCYSYLPYSFSGAIDSWASGVLFDLTEIDGNALSYKNRGQDGQGAGWSAANSVFWQCSAAVIELPKPPTAQNWAFASWCQFQGDGSWTSSNNHIDPRSLYYCQLDNRIKNKNDGFLMPVTGESSSSPSYEVAREMTLLAKKPALQLKDWIDTVVSGNPLNIDFRGIKNIDDIPAFSKISESVSNSCEKNQKINQSSDYSSGMKLQNGWLVSNNKVMTGSRQRVEWWRGNLRPVFTKQANIHLTRYVPGRTGVGFTDDIDTVVCTMLKRGVVALDHNYGLWYDRRRDDHERIRRMDGDVWAPFYEQPFARSGQGLAFDGLSKYDLTKWNYWYWNRLKTFADKADDNGLVLFHQNFFQHNIIEAGAHWTDFTWRTANNINETGFPEPAYYAGNDVNYMFEQFYDLKDPQRKALQRNYIRKCLENFSTNSNVIQFISYEFTGPLHFVQFWLDVIGEWEAETGRNAIIALSTTKDVQDQILADPVRSKLVEVIDTKAWNYLPNGKMYAPAGGLALAPRQYIRLKNKGQIQESGNKPSNRASEATDSDDLIYWSVRDYVDTFPDKAVIYSSEVANAGWPAFMAGGSLCKLPDGLPEGFLNSAKSMKPTDIEGVENCRILGNPETGYIIYCKSVSELNLKPGILKNKFKYQWIDSFTGNPVGKPGIIKADAEIKITAPAGKNPVLWLYK
jgi:hypothetical protein